MQLDDKGFIIHKSNREIKYDALNIARGNTEVNLITYEEVLAMPTGTPVIFDVECWRNFFFVAFKFVEQDKYFYFERSPASDFEGMKMRTLFWRFLTVGFNSINYDIPICELAMAGADNNELKEASDYIIQSGPQYGTEKVTPYKFKQYYGIEIGKYNHIDLIEVAPLDASLKLYAGRLHAKRMQDLPFSPDKTLTEDEAKIARPYCCNDLINTEGLFLELAPELKVRIDMSEHYKIDLKSKSDAQISEAVINKELEKVLGYYPSRPQFVHGQKLKYKVPDFIQFKTPLLQRALEVIRNTEFELDGNGSPIMPKEIEKLKLKIGKGLYKMGMGGLHSSEKCIAHYANEEYELADNDVASFYPKIIINQKLFPEHLGEGFLVVYVEIVDSRLAAKKNDKKKAGMLKIVINGGFGKLGSKWSTLYAPQLMLQVTLSGQLALLMLIEALELRDITVVSANTDGFISRYLRTRREEVRAIIKSWENHCNFETEETHYLATFSRDVNNYIAIKSKFDENSKQWLLEPEIDESKRFLDDKLGCKTKGTYSEKGSALNSVLSKNPEAAICNDAVLLYLVKKIPIEESVYGCNDFRRFLSVRTVKGGAEKNGVYLGKVVRWYYAKNEAGCISYVLSGNKVPTTDGARPCMDLPDEMPSDIDYQWYIRKANEMLVECGAVEVDKQITFF